MKLLVATSTATGVICMGVGIIIGHFGINNTSDQCDDTSAVTTPSSPYTPGPYKHAAVAADAGDCSRIGTEILKKQGSAVDAAIAAMLCIGVINLHSTGVAGGGMMLIYSQKNATAEVIDFREKAPANSTEDMFKDKADDAIYGGRAIAVPGEVAGYHMAWKKYGRLEWKELVDPALKLAKDGFKMGKALYQAANPIQEKLREDPGLRELLFNETGHLYQEGDVITNLKYATTLETIQDHPESFYSGPLANNIILDMERINGTITFDDLRSYQPVKRKALKFRLGDLTMHLTPPPAGGAVLGLILNILKGYNMTSFDREGTNASVLTYHRIVEAFKFGYAWRSRLGDPDFVQNVSSVVEQMLDPILGDYLRQKIWDNQTHDNQSYYGQFFVKEDHGTSHLAVLAQDGDAVSMTSTINFRFGCQYRSTITGMIYNNEMADFDNPGERDVSGLYPSSNNFPEPGKRPLSSVTPVIFTDKNGRVRFVVGASGGKRIITATSLVIMNKLWFGQALSEAVEEPRLHNNLVPNDNVTVEKFEDNIEKYELPIPIQDGLRARGHQVTLNPNLAIVQGIFRDGVWIHAKSDPRKYGTAAGF